MQICSSHAGLRSRSYRLGPSGRAVLPFPAPPEHPLAVIRSPSADGRRNPAVRSSVKENAPSLRETVSDSKKRSELKCRLAEIRRQFVQNVQDLERMEQEAFPAAGEIRRQMLGKLARSAYIVALPGAPKSCRIDVVNQVVRERKRGNG